MKVGPLRSRPWSATTASAESQDAGLAAAWQSWLAASEGLNEAAVGFVLVLRRHWGRSRQDDLAAEPVVGGLKALPAREVSPTPAVS